MARQEVNIGVEGNDGTGDSIRESFRKTNENFQELYAVFGLGGTINFTALSDTPDSYAGDASKIMAVRQDELGLESLELASDSALDDTVPDSIQFNFSEPGKLIVFSSFSRVSDDTEPQLGGNLNANNFAIGKVAVSEAAAQSLAAIFNEDFSIDDLVINKGFAEENFLKRGSPGATANLRSEPQDVSEYVFEIDSFSNSGVVIPQHGLTSSSTGAPYRYSTTGNAATGLTQNAVYFLRVINSNTVSLHLTSTDALTNSNPIEISGGDGTQTITDAAYDPMLAGNWLENEALPRKSVVRRQGDSMEGPLMLHDHPGDFAGSGEPNGPDDLQAATKFYVDNVFYSSTTNIFVNTQGDDLQRTSPPGREGRSPGYAFASINAACRKAEELQEASPFEAGPYMQTITHSQTATASTVQVANIASPVSYASNIRTLLGANREFIKAEVIAFINQQFPDFSYNESTCARDVGLIIDSVILDTASGANANYLSRYAGIRYYSNPSARLAITAQLAQTIAGIEYAKLVSQIVLNNDPVSAPYTQLQSEINQTISPGITWPSNTLQTAIESVGDKFDIVIETINLGPLDARAIVDGSVFRMQITNGGNNFVDQGDPTNTDIIPGKIVIGKQSGAKGIIIGYTSEEQEFTTLNTDRLDVQLVEPIEFIQGEELEYGNTVRFKQVIIQVEAGVYLEDYPIRVPNNVSIRGDEFRRTIIRPKNRISQSRWTDLYFYRDKEFDGLTGDQNSITGFPDVNLPTAGNPYIDPLTGEVSGFFGYHYLLDPTRPRNIGGVLDSVNKAVYPAAAELLLEQKAAIVSSISTASGQNVELAVDAIISDLEKGDRQSSLEAQFEFFSQTTPGDEQLVQDAINSIKAQISQFLSGDSLTAANNLVDVIAFAFNPGYNPARRNFDLDVFLMNDATRLSNMTVQGHGGFMVVLDPQGQILTKSPYIQVGSSFSQSLNRKSFRGGMFVDAFCGNTPTSVIEKVNAFELIIESDPGQGLFFKRPETPAPFYIDGERFQVNAVRDYDPETGTARLLLDRNSNNGNGFSGTTSTLLNVDLDIGDTFFDAASISSDQITATAHGFSNSDRVIYDNNSNATIDGLDQRGKYFVSVIDADTIELFTDLALTEQVEFSQGTGSHKLSRIIDITVQTAGNRSMLGNDFTQINDLGYGLIVVNGGLSEMVSMFTYYTQAAFYAKNGGEIRSLNGSTAYGNFGLVSEGADPNEIPDSVTLRDNMVMPVKAFESVVVLEFATTYTLNAGTVLQQANTLAKGTVIYNTQGTEYSKVYLTDVDGTFSTTVTDTVSIDNDPVGGGTLSAVPTSAITASITNSQEQLFAYAYDTTHPFQNRGEIEIIHGDGSIVPFAIGRYEVSNAQRSRDFIVGGYFEVPAAGGTGNNAEFTVGAVRSASGSYKVYNIDNGLDYSVDDILTIDGADLGGSSGTNNLQLKVVEVEPATGAIVEVEVVSGTPVLNNSTPIHDGSVWRLNFTTGTSGFAGNGLIQDVEADTTAIYRQNAVFVFESVSSVDALVIRPSTAIQFDEFAEATYRSISFSDTDDEGIPLPANSVTSGFDITFRYISLAVSRDDIQTVDPLDASKRLGGQAADTAIAVIEITEQAAIDRLNSGNMIFGWDGKLHRIESYTSPGTGFGIVRFVDLPNSDVVHPPRAPGLASPVDLDNVSVVLRAGLQQGETATITINISTCRATGHDFLDIGTGGFNTSNYPNVIFGLPAQELGPFYVDSEDAVSGQVWERTKGRVFWVSTDQDGFFRVGKFFDVDQGTGTITFSSSIAISDLDGIGFRRGVRVTEFSTDTGMTNNSAETVPVQSAVRGYVNRRLGFDHSGAPVGNRIGPGTLPLNGAVAMTGNLNMGGGNRIVNVGAPAAADDVAIKSYVDAQADLYSRFDNLYNTLVDPVTDRLVGTDQIEVVPLSFDFDASNVSNDQIVFAAAHGFIEGDRVNYNNNTNTDLPGLTQGGKYFVKIINSTTVELYSDSLLETKISISSGSGFHTLTRIAKDTIQKVQPLIVTGLKRLIVAADTISNGPFEVGDEFTGSASGGTGVIKQIIVKNIPPALGNVNVLVFQDTSAPGVSITTQDVITVQLGVGQRTAQVVVAPVDEIANGEMSEDTEIETGLVRQIGGEASFNAANISNNQIITSSNHLFSTGEKVRYSKEGEAELGGVTDGARYFVKVINANTVELYEDEQRINKALVVSGPAGTHKLIRMSEAFLSLTYKRRSIKNIHVNDNAEIAQSKLAMNSATTRANAGGISQADLGLASFDSQNFDSTNGWIEIRDNAIGFNKLTQIGNNKALGNVSGNTANIAELDITTTGQGDSLVRTQSDGSIRVNSLRLGGADTQLILSLDGLTLQARTPGQAVIFTAAGTNSATLTTEFPGNIRSGSAESGQGTIQGGNSNFSNTGRVSSNWIYTKVVEDVGTRTDASNGISFGNNAPFAGKGIVSIFTINDVENPVSSVVPARFSAAGFEPDTDNVYDIGKTDNRYKTIFTVNSDISDQLTVSGQSNLDGDVRLGVNNTKKVVFNSKVDSSILPHEDQDLGSTSDRWKNIFVETASVSGNATITGNATINGNTTLGDTVSDDTVSFNSRVNTNIEPSTTNTRSLGSTSLRWSNVNSVAANFSGAVTVGGKTTLSGAVDLGAGTNQDIRVKGPIASNVLPKGDAERSLGSSSLRFNTVFATALSTGEATNPGTITGNWTLGSGSRLEATYADLAEMYSADLQYEAGTVVVFGGEEEVTLTEKKGDHRVAGIVSTNPAYLMNSGLNTEYAVAIGLQGRLPCKVLGKVRKGDLLVTSATPGYAVVDNNAKAGSVIGKALENKEDGGKGVIEVVVGRS